MSPPKVTCPGCQTVLKIAEAFPARVRCPRCQAGFQVDSQGTATPGSPAPAESPSQVALLGAVSAVAVLVLVLGGGLLAYCLQAPAPEAMVDDEEVPVEIASKRPKKKAAQLEPVALIKRGPQKSDRSVGSAFEGQPPDGIPSGIAKPISSPPPPPVPTLSMKDKKINAAIDNGVGFLLQGLDESGRFLGVADQHGNTTGAAALTGLTLLSCGVAGDHPKVLGLIQRIRTEAPASQRAYDVAACIWFLDKLDQKVDSDLIRRLALRLIANQDATGCWDYQCHAMLTDQQEVDLQRLLEELPEAAAPPAGKLTPAPKTPVGKKPANLPAAVVLKNLPVFHYKSGQALPRSGRQDNSLTQFAVLALWAAQKHGAPAQRSLAFAEAHFRQSQNPDGTWPYVATHAKAYCNDSMTCAGLLGLAVGRGLDKSTTAAPRDLAKDPQVEKALVYLGQRVGLAELGLPAAEIQKLRDEAKVVAAKLQSKNKAEREAAQKRQKELNDLITTNTATDARGKTIHAASWGDYYFLWSLERTAVVYDLATIGGQDWYEWGADIIVKNQSSDGCWRDSFPGLIDTCFALLFLKRANVVQDLTMALRDLGGATDPGAGLAKPTVQPPAKQQSPTRETLVVGLNKIPVVSSRPGTVKLRTEQPMPVGNRPQARTRRRRIVKGAT